MKNKWMARMAMLLLTALLLSAAVGCGEKDVTGAEALIYENEKLGLSLTFPDDWKDKYEIEEEEDGFVVYHKEIRKSEWGGMIATVRRVDGELITEEEFSESIHTRGGILIQGNGYTYTWIMAGDVQYPPEDEKLTKEFREMTDTFAEDVTAWAKLSRIS